MPVLTPRLFVLLALLALTACGGDDSPDSSDDRMVFDVEYADKAKVIEESDGKSLLLGEPPSASTMRYHFEPSATEIAALQPGDLAVLAGIAYRKVVEVQTNTSSITLITERTTLPEVIRSGTMEWSQAVNFATAVEANGLTVGDTHVLSKGLETPITYNGEIKGYQVSLTLTPSANRLDITAEVSLEVLGEKRFAVEAVGHMEGFRSEGRAVFSDGETVEFEVGQQQVRGEMKLTAAAFNTGLNDEILSIPFGIDIPIQIGPVPFILKLKANVNVRLILSVANSSAEAEVEISFSSDQGVRLEGSALRTTGASGSGSFAGLTGGSVDSVAAGMSTCVEFPRYELSVRGEFASVGVTQNNCAQTVFVFDPACNQVRGSLTIFALANLGFFGVTLAEAQVELFKTEDETHSGMCD